MAAIELAEALKVLEGSASVLEAVRYYAKMRPPRMPRKSVPEVVVELLDAKTADGASDVYAKDLRLRLKKLGDKFPGQISLINTSEVDEFLRTLLVKGSGQHAHRLSGRSGNNYRRANGMLFKFAHYRELVRPKDAEEWFNIKPAGESEGKVAALKQEAA
jgi:hypothetical protein